MGPTKKLILGLLSQEPRTTLELIKATGISRSCMTVNLRHLKKKGLLKIVGKKPTDGLPAPIYATHTHYPMPSKDDPVRASRKESPTFVAIVRALSEHKRLTIEEIADFAQVSKSRIQSAMTYYREGGKTSKVFRIAEWQRVQGSRRGWIPVYAKGPAPDAKKPSADRKQVQAEWRARHRASIRAKATLVRSKQRGDEQPLAANPFFQLYQVTGSVYAAVQHEAREAA